MKGFIITALTDIGTSALDQCIQEEKIELADSGLEGIELGDIELSHISLLDRLKLKKKLNRLKKKLKKNFEKIWIREIKRDPLSYSMFIHQDAERLLLQSDPRLIDKAVGEVKVAMMKNGAELGIDYYVEVFS